LRGIRLRLQEWDQGLGGRVVLVTSAERGEGKTSVAAALALRAAGDGVRVLLVEGDLHRPSLAEDLKMTDRSHGLEAAVSGKLHREKFLEIHADTQLHCLFARAAAPNAIELLDSRGFSRLIEEARSIYDLIVIDGPPILRVPDPLVLSRWADRIIWVVRAERTPQRLIVEALKRFPADRRALVATVLTGAPKRMLTGFGFYAGYSGRSQLPALEQETQVEWSRSS
jgi:capsular exopolysaccharide synthesis family protein